MKGTYQASRSSDRAQPGASRRRCRRGGFGGSRPAGPTSVRQFVQALVAVRGDTDRTGLVRGWSYCGPF